MQRLASLWSAEHIQRRRKRNEKGCTNFYKNPYTHARQLLEEATVGKLETTRDKLEEYIRRQ